MKVGLPRSKKVTPTGDGSKRAKYGAMAHALIPLAKVCLRSGLGAGELIVAAKLACIQVAAEDAKIGNRLNHSRISAITGLTRKDIRALQHLEFRGTRLAPRPIARQRTARVLHGWRTDPEFLDKRGRPIELRIRGAGVTFGGLVRRYGGDVTPVAVLNELLRAGAVSRAPQGLLRVRRSSLRVKGFGPEMVSELFSRLQDLGNTMVCNIEDHARPLFVGFKDVRDLKSDEAALFHATFSERAATLVDSVDRWRKGQRKLHVRTHSSNGDKVRVGLGVYLVRHETEGNKRSETLRRRSSGSKDSSERL